MQILFSNPFRRLRAILGVSLAATLALSGPAAANKVTNDLVPLGSAWGGPHGHVPGDFMFSEDLIKLIVLDFWSGGVPCCFNEAVIQAPVVDSGGGWVFGSVQCLNINNVNVHYDYAAIPTSGPESVRFSYLQLGGSVNVDVNGAGLVEAPNWPALHLAVLPGGATCVVDPALQVPVDMNLDGVPDGHRGVVRIDAPFPIDGLAIGGQELWVDEQETTRGSGPCPAYIGHESQAPGTVYGAPVAMPIGSFMYSEGGVDLLTEQFFPLVGPPLYNQANIDPVFPAPVLFGTDLNTLRFNNMNVRFQIPLVGVTEVQFDWLDLGGTENLSVNGFPLHIGELDAAPAFIAPGVVFSTSSFPVPGGKKGRARLVGNVFEIVLGGQELWHDNMCVQGTFAATDAPSLGPDSNPTGLLQLESVAPNPFRADTRLDYSLGRGGHVRATVYDLAGRQIRRLVDGPRSAGPNQTHWDGRDGFGRTVATGTYFVRVESGAEVQTRKVMFLR